MIRILLLCSTVLAAPVFCAQDRAWAQETPTATAKPAQSAPSREELLPLNFYVQQKDDASTRAELRRLQLKYPGWAPPADLGRLAITAPSAEIDQIYRQIAAGQYDGARSTIAATRTAFPDWVPPEDMTRLLATSEAQGQLDQALSSGNMGRALDLAYSTPGLLRCDRINNAWRIADAQHAAGKTADALATYRAVLSACSVPKDLQATLEKASGLASPAEMDGLFQLVEHRFPAQQTTYTALRARLLPGSAAATAEEVAKTEARPQPKAKAAASVAADSPAAPAKRQASSGTVTTKAPSSASSGDWRSCLARTAGSRQAAVLYERGWCAYNLDQSMEALTAFKAALQGRLGAEQRRDGHFGMALSYLKLKMPNEAARIAAAVDLTPNQRVEVEGQILDQRGVAAYNNKNYADAIAYFDALQKVRGGIARDLAIMRAYAYLNAGHRAEARRQFELLNRQLSTRETRRGLEAAVAN